MSCHKLDRLNRSSVQPPELFAQLEHSEDWRFGALANGFRQSDLRLHVKQRVVGFFQRVHFHEPALAAKAIVGRARYESLAWNLLFQPVQHARFGDNDNFVSGRLFAKRDHFFRGTDFVGQHSNGVGTFRMSDDWGVRILFANPIDASRSELDMHITIALP